MNNSKAILISQVAGQKSIRLKRSQIDGTWKLPIRDDNGVLICEAHFTADDETYWRFSTQFLGSEIVHMIFRKSEFRWQDVPD